MVRHNNNSSKKYVSSQYLLAGLLFLLLLLFAFFYFFIASKLDDPVKVNSTEITTEEQTLEESQPSKFDEMEKAKIQEAVKDWASGIDGTYSVVVLDADGEVIDSIDPDQVYFAASIYKIYVAYAGYQQIDAGLVDPEELYINGNTRAECLDLMIRDSDSPCAEKLWNEYGKEKLTSELETYGIENTSMSGVTTTAEDAAILLLRVANGEGLSETSKAAYLDSMKYQDDLYRRGLPTGFDSLTVYNKVGWNELVEWHDAAIIELPDGRQLVVSVFTENVGYRKIAELGNTLETYLLSL